MSSARSEKKKEEDSDEDLDKEMEAKLVRRITLVGIINTYGSAGIARSEFTDSPETPWLRLQSDKLFIAAEPKLKNQIGRCVNCDGGCKSFYY